MPTRIGVLFVLLNLVATLESSSRRVQEPSPSLNSIGAKTHVGEVATVCGQVVDYGCDKPYTTLTFEPATDPEPFTVRLVDEDGTTFGRRAEERFLDRVICVSGRIEKLASSYRISVADTNALRVIKELLPAARPFAPEAHTPCAPGVVLPRAKRSVTPQYTASALSRKIEGKVLMRGVVKVDGRVGDMQVLRSLEPGLDIEAMRAFKQWTFSPGTYAGEPAPVIVTMEMAFSLRK
ncbi:MAG TPA: energy transducer TonB [Vicinamibacterales bacterium]|nr:energy transducer TonB [Vicinamibacterales bacterium]